MMKPLVSVCVFTYNHKKFIGLCIESVLAQKTNFDIEIIIGEDYSTDGTKEVCEFFAGKYPQQIRVLDRGRNLGLCENYLTTLQECKGKYVALIDGDDYWINPLKLQMQFDYLERESGMNLVFHQTIRINDLTNSIDFFVKSVKPFYVIDDVIKDWFIATGSIFFRKEAIDFPDFLKTSPNFDLAIQMIVSRDGSTIGYINEPMSVYHINAGSNTNNTDYNLFNTWQRLKILFNNFDIYTGKRYEKQIRDKIGELEKLIYDSGRFSLKRQIKNLSKVVINFFGYKLIKSK